MRAVCRLRRFAWGRPGAKGRVSEQVRHTTFVPVPPRYGFAVFIPACYSSTPCALYTCVRSSPCVRIRSRIAAVRTRLQGHKVFRAGRIRPSRPLAQTVSVSADLFGNIRRRPESALPATDCAVRPASASLRCPSILPSVPVRDCRRTPHQCLCTLTLLGRSGPGPGGRLSNPSAACLCRGLGA